MKNLSFILSTIFVLTSLESCRWFRMDFTDNKLIVVNSADYDVSVLVNFEYPDTSLEMASPNAYIPANDSGSVVVINQYWEDVLKKIKAISLFFVPRDSLRKYYPNWEGKLKPEKRMTLTKSQLDSINWRVIFP